MLDWAVANGYFLESRAKSPTFGLRGRSGERILSVLSDGAIYWYANEGFYPGGAAERNRLREGLERIQMLDPGFDPLTVVHGRNLARKLTELREDEFKSLLDVLSVYCGTPEKA